MINGCGKLEQQKSKTFFVQEHEIYKRESKRAVNACKRVVNKCKQVTTGGAVNKWKRMEKWI